jgi:hypothetical protein
MGRAWQLKTFCEMPSVHPVPEPGVEVWCNRSLVTVLASQAGDAMNFFVEAKHPHGGGMVLVLCRTRGEALQAIANLKK